MNKGKWFSVRDSNIPAEKKNCAKLCGDRAQGSCTGEGIYGNKKFQMSVD